MAKNLNGENKVGIELYHAKKFVNRLKKYIPNNIKIETQKNLQYVNYFHKIDSNGYGIEGKSECKKMCYAIDILLTEDNIPRVAIEVKIKSYTTHDIITYSEKAGTHKNLFPHLQYGFLCLESTNEKLSSRYHLHNKIFDFGHIVPVGQDTDHFIQKYVKELESMIKESREIEKNIFNKKL